MNMKKRRKKKSNYVFLLIPLLCIIVILAAGLLIINGYQKRNSKEQETEGIQESEKSLEEEEQSPENVDDEQHVEDDDQNKENINNDEMVTMTAELYEEEQEEVTEKEVKDKISVMSLEEKVLQMFMVTPEALTGAGSVTQAGPQTQAAVNQYPVGGLIYFRNNIVSEEQFSTMIRNIQQYSQERIGLPLLIGVDEEGGTVRRVTGRGFADVPDIGDMYDIGATGDASKAYEVGSQIGSYLKRFQFNVDFAPDADVFSNPNNTVIGRRSFGSDADLVGAMVEQEVIGLQEQGVYAALKHFPGHGDTSEDSHNGMATSWKTMEEIRTCELIPFQKGIDAGAKFVMVGHISYPNILSSDIPASLSYTMVTDILRTEMGFDGVVITDAMNMGAIANRYHSSEAAVKAVEAGVDLILMPNDFASAYQGVVNAVKEGRISEERINQSLERILKIKFAG